MNVEEFVRRCQCEELASMLSLDMSEADAKKVKKRAPKAVTSAERERINAYARDYYSRNVEKMRAKGREKSKAKSEQRAWMKEHDPEGYEALLAKGREYQRKRYRTMKAATA